MAEKEHPVFETVGVIGAGSFGTAIANVLSENVDVLLYSRHDEQIREMNETHKTGQISLSERVRATGSLAELTERCRLIFPIIPSSGFREMMRGLAPFLHPYHFLIHGTKGFDLTGDTSGHIHPSQVHTLSQVITQESVVIRVGCLGGPNLAAEIHEGQPAATVIGSRFDEVIDLGRSVLQSSRFHVFGTHDILGAELAGALKNAIAIGSGILAGMGLGKNMQALLITRGLTEMIYFGKALGATPHAFLGTAGIGDLIATATSEKSRNFSLGYRLAGGESLEKVQTEMPELAEGVRTLKIIRDVGRYYKINTPITSLLYRTVYDGLPPQKAIDFLMTHPWSVDVDFL
ncbi:MAG: NAD(P)H-dependent glycerol-3-phosphate dehydrogenase [Saprospiraceae bacterium]|jgi:glycerol-3-phosphate dehydrogenase (NAD(P)+)